jgi:hypothetical protein
MEQPVAVRFRWTADELLQAYRYHFRHICRPVFRFGLHFIFALFLFCGVVTLTALRPDDKSPLLVSIGFLVVGIYWFAIRPFDRRWTVRRRFSKRPDRDIEIEWQAFSDKVLIHSALAQSEASWQAFAKMVRTPSGFLLYPNDQMFHWLPRHGFASDTEFDRFDELTKGKIRRRYIVA